MNVNLIKPLNRRTVLRGAGACLALPLLEAMLPSAQGASSRFKPRAECPQSHPRMIACYVPQGVNMYDWFPQGGRPDWTITPTLKALAGHRSEFTVFTGLGHPRSTGGHQGDHTWLTGADLKGTPGRDYQNSVSMDQIAAELHGKQTRFPSLELSADRSLAYDQLGTPLPAEKHPHRLFERLFVPPGDASKQATLRRHAERTSILDAVLTQAQSLHKRLGRTDQEKLEEYLGSVRETERRVERMKQWIDVPFPVVDRADLRLSSRPGDSHDLGMWIDVMLELSYLAFQTDSTRVITFEWAREAGAVSPIGEDHHALSHHGGDSEKLKKLAAIDRFFVGRLARFLGLLKATREPGGTMLDTTMVLYGSGMNSGAGGGHSPENLPVLLAGGGKLGLRHGRHLKVNPNTSPMSNLLLTMLQKMSVEANSFSDSRSTLTGLT